MPRLFAAAPASTMRVAEVSPNCSLITFNNCKLFSSTLTSQHPTPPGPTLYALLSTWGIGAGPRCPLRLLLDHLRGFSRLLCCFYGREALHQSGHDPTGFGV